MKIVIVNGAPGAGKDTFVNYCSEALNGHCLNVSTVDFVKEIARECGWDGVKTPKNRKFLSDLKKLLTDWDDVPYKKVESEIKLFQSIQEYQHADKAAVVFIHCREPQEIDKFKKRLNASTLLMRRASVENLDQSNSSDSDVFKYNYDYEISNDTTLGELRIKALEFVHQLLLT